MEQVTLGVESLLAGRGGICRVARLMALVLAEEVAEGRLKADAVALTDETSPPDVRLPVRCKNGSRVRFVADVWKAASRSSHFIYDFLGMARAHPRLPAVRKPFMTWLHGVEVWEDARPDRLRWARRAELLVANTQYTLDRAEKVHGKLGNAVVCWLATEKDDLPTARKEEERPPTVIVVGRLDRSGYKGHVELIRSWPDVASAVPDARLLIAGDGPGLQELRREAQDAKAADGIEFLGFVPEVAMEDLWARVDVCAMPSRGEGFGLVYVEAMRHGVPVVASVHDAAPEVNVEGETGFNVDLDKPSELVERLVYLLSHPSAAWRIGKRGQQRWARHFRYSSFRQRFRPILARFLSCGRTALN